MPRFRKKPVEIEAVQWTGSNWDEVFKLGPSLVQPAKAESGREAMPIEITTLEGTMRADVGDWIIKGVQGELYPCKADIFAQTYDRVEPVDCKHCSCYRSPNAGSCCWCGAKP